MYERRYYYISEKKSISGYLVPHPPKSFLMVGDYTHMSHYKEKIFKASIPACRSKRVKVRCEVLEDPQPYSYLLLIGETS